ncbi:MAG: DUF1801 domain-containing protein [Gemmatimonadaceae bacterium]
MVMSRARTADEYLAELPPERRVVVGAVRDVLRRSLPAGYAETMGYGMISYGVPLARYPDTYNGQPLCYAALAAQKSHLALYLKCAYGDPERAAWLRAAFERAGKRYDAGKSCIRFQRLEDLPLDAIGEFVAGCSVDRFIAQHEAARAGAAANRAAKKTGATKTGAKKAGAKKAGAKKAGAKKAGARTASAKKTTRK